MSTNTTAYMMPLFEQYPVSVEFDRRKQLLEGIIAANPGEYQDRARAEALGANFEICPIELRIGTCDIYCEPEGRNAQLLLLCTRWVHGRS